jgi:hypothetical protein
MHDQHNPSHFRSLYDLAVCPDSTYGITKPIGYLGAQDLCMTVRIRISKKDTKIELQDGKQP